jgi:hypothetical protein
MTYAITSVRGQAMFDKLNPRVYENSDLYRAICDAAGHEFDDLRAAIYWASNQLFPDSADEVGIAFHERLLGLNIDVAKPLAQRRTQVISRYRVAAPPTLPNLIRTAATYENGQVRIYEDFNGHIYVQFVGQFGIPPNLADLQAALIEQGDAGLVWHWLFLYVTNTQRNAALAGSPRTNAQTNALGLTNAQRNVTV